MNYGMPLFFFLELKTLETFEHCLQGTKIYGKQSLKFVPLIGWAWMFTESIFLRRDWDQDRQIISQDLKYICDYPDGYWVTVSQCSF